MKPVLDAQSKSSSVGEDSGERNRPSVPQAVMRRRILTGCIVAACVVGVGYISVSSAWRQTELREAYLPDIQARAAADPGDSQVAAILGIRQAQARDAADSQKTLMHAAEAGDTDSAVWQALAFVYAEEGDIAHCNTAINTGMQPLYSPTPDMVAAASRVRGLPPGSSPAQFAAAVAPTGLDPLADTYISGSYLNPLSEWWGNLHPDSSGFATRESMAREHPGSAEALRLWGLALAMNGRIFDAIPVLQHAVMIAPNSASARLALGQTLEAGGDPVGASNQYMQALILSPNLGPAALGLGKVNENVNKHVAYAAYKIATQSEPESVDAWLGLARMEGLSGFYADAGNAYATALKLAPGRTDFLDAYAAILTGAGEYDQAETMLRSYIAANSGDATGHEELGTLLMQYNPTPQRLAEAESETRTAGGIASDWEDPYQQLGRILVMENKPAAALQFLKLAVRMQPSDDQAMRMLTQALQATGQTAAATAAANREAAADAIKQRSVQFEAERAEKYLDPDYHRQMIAFAEQTGDQALADSERNILLQLLADPRGFASRWNTYKITMAKALQTSPDALFR